MKGAFRSFKRVILVITLLIPVCIFLFLKYFGKNKYSLPVYYETAAEIPARNCEFGKFPYKIEFFPFIDPKGNPTDTRWMRGKISMVSIYDSIPHKEDNLKASYIDRIISETPISDKFQVVNIYVNSGSEPKQLATSNELKPVWKVTGSFSDVSHFARCGLILSDTISLWDQWVLVDPQGRIRGYYDNRSFDEIDRLRVEIKILLRDDEQVK